MAFQSAANYGNLPNGNFSPTIFSKKVQKQLRKSAVAEAVTNTDYFGEISSMGDSVRIIKEPEILVRPYARGTQITPQDIVDEDFTLIVDRANYFAFTTDDIEKQQAHVNWLDLASDRAAYKMRDTYDRDILGYMSGFEENNGVWTARTSPVGTKAEDTADMDELLGANKLDRANFVAGATPGTSVSVGLRGTYDTTPLAIFNRAALRLNLLNVDQEGRFAIVSPEFVEKLLDEDNKLVNNDYGGNGQNSEGLKNGQLSQNKIRGFKVYVSNNLPQIGAGPGVVDDAGSTTDYGFIIFGHQSAVATASQINKTESHRSTTSFGDVIRGMQMYGRKILRPEALGRVAWNSAH